MPFYIESIYPKSAWHGDLSLLKHQEIKDIINLNTDWLEAIIVNQSKLCVETLCSRGVTLRWEDYPSEDCRAGLLDPPLQSPTFIKQSMKHYKEPKDLDI